MKNISLYIFEEFCSENLRNVLIKRNTIHLPSWQKVCRTSVKGLENTVGKKIEFKNT